MTKSYCLHLRRTYTALVQKKFRVVGIVVLSVLRALYRIISIQNLFKTEAGASTDSELRAPPIAMLKRLCEVQDFSIVYSLLVDV